MKTSAQSSKNIFYKAPKSNITFAVAAGLLPIILGLASSKAQAESQPDGSNLPQVQLIPLNSTGRSESAATSQTLKALVNPGDGSQLLESLTTLEIPATYSSRAELSQTDKIFAELQLEILPNREGVKSTELPDRPVRVGVSTASVIRDILNESRKYPMGPKAKFLHDSVERVLATSGRSHNEVLTRMTLNRAKDAMNLVLPSLGRNSESLAQFIAAFYTNAYGLALNYASKQSRLYSAATFTEIYVNNVYIADFGEYFSLLLMQFLEESSISNSARAILLIKALGYAGWDVHLDLRSARVEAAIEMLERIYNLQKNDATMKAVRNSLKNHEEPQTNDLRRLTSKIYQILKSYKDVVKELSHFDPRELRPQQSPSHP